jgi:diguanylate cyclase (GGDEF)-like protein
MLTYADITDLVQTAEQLHILATVDDLTKVLNRRQFLASLENEFKRAHSGARPLSVMMIDADDFKRVNDQHGHSVGDEVLRAVAERCRAIVRKSDIVGRVGGEEFAAALTETDLAAAVQTAERLRRQVAEEPFEIGDTRLSVTISIGVADRQSDDADAAQLLRLADRALYTAKANGRNQVVADRRLVRSPLILAAVALAAAYHPAFAGSPSAAGATVTPRNYTLTPQAGQPIGNFLYLGNGMVVPRSSTYSFTWQGRPCQTLNGTTFCQ